MKLYFRLAAGGIRRNSRLYVPYIMTCSLMVMMYYITDALSSDEMLSAMRGGYIMHELIIIGKVVMALFAAIFLFYTNSFLIKSRMREFGLYNILGMGKNGIARVMTWETLMVYVISPWCSGLAPVSSFQSSRSCSRSRSCRATRLISSPSAGRLPPLRL